MELTVSQRKETISLNNFVAAADVNIVVIIPSYRQPGLLPEAIASVLDQTGAPPTAIVIVDDGCPYPASAQVALDGVIVVQFNPAGECCTLREWWHSQES